MDLQRQVPAVLPASQRHARCRTLSRHLVRTTEPKPLLDGHQIIGDFAKAGSLTNRLRDQLDEAFIDAPLLDANGNFVLYQIFVNQSFWEYATGTGYYNGSKQIDDVNAGTFVDMPKWGNANDGVPYYDDIPPYAQQGLPCP